MSLVIEHKAKNRPLLFMSIPGRTLRQMAIRFRVCKSTRLMAISCPASKYSLAQMPSLPKTLVVRPTPRQDWLVRASRSGNRVQLGVSGDGHQRHELLLKIRDGDRHLASKRQSWFPAPAMTPVCDPFIRATECRR